MIACGYVSRGNERLRCVPDHREETAQVDLVGMTAFFSGPLLCACSGNGASCLVDKAM